MNCWYDTEKLIVNTVIVEHEKDSKLEDFLEETIFKRLGVLNDLLLKVFKFFIKVKISKSSRRLMKVSND